MSTSQSSLPTHHTTNTRDEPACPQRNSNPLSRWSGRRPTPCTARPLGSAVKIQCYMFWPVCSQIKREDERFWRKVASIFEFHLLWMSACQFLICERNVHVMSFRTTGLYSLVLWTVKRSCVQFLLSNLVLTSFQLGVSLDCFSQCIMNCLL